MKDASLLNNTIAGQMFSKEDLEFVDYEFTQNNLAEFKYFSIKLIGASSNMANPPRLKNLRVIALAYYEIFQG